MISMNETINNKLISLNRDKIKYYFFNTKNVIKEDLIFTSDSLYSSSKLLGSKRLIDIIFKHFKKKNLIITDCTANIGTDAINLAHVFKFVNAVEISELNYLALENNINTFNLKNKMKCYHNDINNIIDNLQQDVIYIDAPWGGPNYKNKTKIDLYLGDIDIVDFYLMKKNIKSVFIFKVPCNYNFDKFYSKTKKDIYKYSYKKNDIIKYFYILIDNR